MCAAHALRTWLDILRSSSRCSACAVRKTRALSNMTGRGHYSGGLTSEGPLLAQHDHRDGIIQSRLRRMYPMHDSNTGTPWGAAGLESGGEGVGGLWSVHTALGGTKREGMKTLSLMCSFPRASRCCRRQTAWWGSTGLPCFN